MERVHSIDLRIPPGLDSCHLPKLQSISLNIQHLGITCNRQEFKLSTIFEDCRFPAVRSVIIMGTIAELPPSLLGSGLRSLKLSLESTGIGALETEIFVRALSQMSQLEQLYLEGAVLRKRKLVSNSTEGLDKKVLLPALRQLELLDSCAWVTESVPQYEDLSELLALLSAADPDHDHDDHYCSLFETLELPSAQCLRLVFRTPLPTESYRMPQTFWQAFLKCRSLSMCRCLLLQRQTRFTWDMWLLKKLDLEKTNLEMEPIYHVRLYGLSVLQDISENINLEYIETVCVYSHLNDPNNAKHWEQLLGKCSRVKVLMLTGVVVYPLIKILSESRYLRHLELISLSGVFWNGEGPGFHRNLEKLVKTRNTTGIPLRKIMIDGCMDVSIKEVGSLRELGVEVDWNKWATLARRP